jgi:cobalt/nickel transport system ATP-binding protein
MIDAHDLTYAYPDGTLALKGVSFHLEDGKKYALAGPNGAGKSTLLSLLCALEFPEGGGATVDDLPLEKSNAEAIRHRVGMVFQNPDDQLFMPTVYDDVAFGLKNRKLPAEDVEARVAETLESMGIAHLRDRPPYRLSGGEKRAVALATALVMRPKFLLMDEPTAFLDPRAKRALVRTLRALPVGMLIATHDLGFADTLADGVLILKDGRLLAQGGPELLKDAKLMKEALLDDE